MYYLYMYYLYVIFKYIYIYYIYNYIYIHVQKKKHLAIDWVSPRRPGPGLEDWEVWHGGAQVDVLAPPVALAFPKLAFVPAPCAGSVDSEFSVEISCSSEWSKWINFHGLHGMQWYAMYINVYILFMVSFVGSTLEYVHPWSIWEQLLPCFLALREGFP